MIDDGTGRNSSSSMGLVVLGLRNGLSTGNKDQQSVGGSDQRMEGGREDLKELNKSLNKQGPVGLLEQGMIAPSVSQ